MKTLEQELHATQQELDEQIRIQNHEQRNIDVIDRQITQLKEERQKSVGFISTANSKITSLNEQYNNQPLDAIVQATANLVAKNDGPTYDPQLFDAALVQSDTQTISFYDSAPNDVLRTALQGVYDQAKSNQDLREEVNRSTNAEISVGVVVYPSENSITPFHVSVPYERHSEGVMGELTESVIEALLHTDAKADHTEHELGFLRMQYHGDRATLVSELRSHTPQFSKEGIEYVVVDLDSEGPDPNYHEQNTIPEIGPNNSTFEYTIPERIILLQAEKVLGESYTNLYKNKEFKDSGVVDKSKGKATVPIQYLQLWATEKHQQSLGPLKFLTFDEAVDNITKRVQEQNRDAPRERVIQYLHEELQGNEHLIFDYSKPSDPIIPENNRNKVISSYVLERFAVPITAKCLMDYGKEHKNHNQVTLIGMEKWLNCSSEKVKELHEQGILDGADRASYGSVRNFLDKYRITLKGRWVEK